MEHTHNFGGYSPEPPKRGRRSYFVPYLILFGVIIGVLLSNTIRPLFTGGDQSEPSEDIMPVADRTVAMGETPAVQPTALSIPSEAAMLTDYEQMVIAATRHAIPAVVSIYTTGTQYVRYSHPIFDMLYGGQEREVGGMGSGVIIDADGTILTNEHVIDVVSRSRDARISVELYDGRRFDATIERALYNQDLAILHIDGHDLPYLELSEDALVQGQTVLAIGNPFGISEGGQPTITRGIVSATNRKLAHPADRGTKYLRNMIQTDASINPGNSGGALVDLNGRLVGINTAIYAAGGEGSIGIGFAIPARQVRFILESVAKYPEGTAITSGISVQPLTNSLARALEYPIGQGGVVISDVDEDSPGDRDGFQPGDIITQINGFSVGSIDQAGDILRGAFPGEQFEMQVFRDSDYLTIQLVLGEKE